MKGKQFAGDESDAQENPSDKELLDALWELGQDLDKLPSPKDIKRNLPWTRSRYQRTFGSVPKARRLAGYTDTPQSVFCRWLEIKKPPTKDYFTAKEIADSMDFDPRLIGRALSDSSDGVVQTGLGNLDYHIECYNGERHAINSYRIVPIEDGEGLQETK